MSSPSSEIWAKGRIAELEAEVARLRATLSLRAVRAIADDDAYERVVVAAREVGWHRRTGTITEVDNLGQRMQIPWDLHGREALDALRDALRDLDAPEKSVSHE